MNKLNNQGYFVNRLKNCGYSVSRLDIDYSDVDPRSWTVVINPGSASVLCTCYVNGSKENIKRSAIGDNFFELYDGGQFLPNKLKLTTSSIEVVVTYLVENGILGNEKS